MVLLFKSLDALGVFSGVVVFYSFGILRFFAGGLTRQNPVLRVRGGVPLRKHPGHPHDRLLLLAGLPRRGEVPAGKGLLVHAFLRAAADFALLL